MRLPVGFLKPTHNEIHVYLESINEIGERIRGYDTIVFHFAGRELTYRPADFIRMMETVRQALRPDDVCYYLPDDAGYTWRDEHGREHYEEDSASEDCGSASCDRCGNPMLVGDDGWFTGWDKLGEWWENDGRRETYHKGYLLRPTFRFCPGCGRKVIPEPEHGGA